MTTLGLMTLSIMTFGIMSYGMKGFFATFSLNDTQHNKTLSVIMLSVTFYSL
jgi:hypothetical protein